MHKHYFFFLLISLIGLSANAQLAQSRWLAIAGKDSTRQFTIEFGSDSAVLLSLDSTVYEKMSFKIDHGKLELQKGIGSTLCSTEDVVLYDFKMKENNLELRLVSDPCGQRSRALSGYWTKQ